MLATCGKLPDYVVACVGGGSNAIGIFHPFVDDKEVAFVGVEAAGEGTDTAFHSATLSKGTPGVLHGTRTYLLQTPEGQITETHRYVNVYIMCVCVCGVCKWTYVYCYSLINVHHATHTTASVLAWTTLAWAQSTRTSWTRAAQRTRPSPTSRYGEIFVSLFFPL